jgi:hypothetical protein
MRSLILLLALASPAMAVEKKEASASMSVTATVVAPPMPPEQVEGVIITDTVDENGEIIMRTFVYPYEE